MIHAILETNRGHKHLVDATSKLYHIKGIERYMASVIRKRTKFLQEADLLNGYTNLYRYIENKYGKRCKIYIDYSDMFDLSYVINKYNNNIGGHIIKPIYINKEDIIPKTKLPYSNASIWLLKDIINTTNVFIH